jgi:dihydroxy-acid dehydratase
MIDIDVDQRTLSVRLSDEEIQSRIAALPPFTSRTKSRWLRRYAKFVTDASRGAVLRE